MPQREKTHRLFFAFALPPKALTACAQFQHTHRNLDVRWIPQDTIHITLLFLGTTHAGKFQDIVRIGSAIVRQRKTSPIRFVKFGWAPPGATSHMVWLYVEKSPAWTDMKTRLRESLARIGAYRQTDERDFHGHATLARFNPKPRKELTEILTLFQFEYRPGELLLMESELSSKGAAYKILERFTFPPQR